MKDKDKTKEELINELVKLRSGIAELETSETQWKTAVERYQYLFDQSPDFITTLDRKEVITSVNRAGLKLSGYSEDELVGKHFSKIAALRAGDIPHYRKLFTSIVQGKVSQLFEVTYQCKDGSSRWAEAHICLIIIGGKKRGVQVVLRDITRYKQAEKRVKYLNLALRAIRNVNQLIIKEKNPDRLLQGIGKTLTETRGYFNVWIVLLDTSGRFLKVYQAGLGKDFLPMSKQLQTGQLTRCATKALSQSDPVIIKDPSSTCSDCPLSKKYGGQAGITVRLEYEGTTYGILSASIPADFTAEKEEHWLFKEVAGDIAFALYSLEQEEKYKKADESLRESEKKLRLLTENTRDVICLHHPDGRYLYVSPSCQKILGYEPEELIGKDPYQLVHLDDRERVQEESSKVLKGENILIHYRIQKKSGEYIWFESTNQLIKDEKGNIIQSVSVSRDITQRKKAEEEKKQLQAQLLQAQKLEAIGTLAGGVAHDFNNLLTAIQGYTDLCMMRVDEADSLYRDLKQIRNASFRAADLTRQLLAFSRKQPIRLTSLNINKTVEGLKKMLTRLLGEDIAIETNLTSDPWTVEADEGQIEQIIMNLAVNAREAMPQGGRLTITTENVLIDEAYSNTYHEARPGRFVRLSLQDSGVGIDKETIQHIFEPFFTTRKVGKGTGLGLSVVYGIVKQHQGWINVCSEVNQGSVFKIYLPASLGKTKDKVKETISLKDLQGAGEKILLVEDEKEVRKIAQTILSKNGYLVFEVKDTQEARKIFEREEENFNLIFSDVVLPDGSGLTLIEELLSRKPNLSILLSSGYADRKCQWPAIEKKGFPFLEKPYTLSNLLRAIKEAIKRSGEDQSSILGGNIKGEEKL